MLDEQLLASSGPQIAFLGIQASFLIRRRGAPVANRSYGGLLCDQVDDDPGVGDAGHIALNAMRAVQDRKPTVTVIADEIATISDVMGEEIRRHIVLLKPARYCARGKNVVHESIAKLNSGPIAIVLMQVCAIA
jgi:hypothetical protein